MGDSSSGNIFDANIGSKKASIDHKHSIPAGYGDNKIVLMVRDPWTIFSYWEIRADIEEAVNKEIEAKGLTPSESILRVYDVTGGIENISDKKTFDFTLKNWVDRWYVHTGNPGREWMVEIGIVCSNGEFFVLARSNVVKAPNYGMSETYDERWMCSEDLYYKMFAMSGGHGIGTSSFSIKEMIERQLKDWVSSGGFISSMFGSASLFPRKKEKS